MLTPELQKQIEQMNEAIARFMGGSSIKEHGGKRYVYYPKSCAKPVLDLKYHTSWELLMPVVEKINKLATSGDAINGITENIIFSFSIFAPLKDVHKAVYQFITWYSQQKQTNE